MMEQKNILTSKKTVINILSGLAVLLVLGSFLDYQLSAKLFNLNNPFGIFMAAFGEYPAALGLICAGILMMRTNYAKKWIWILKQIGCAILICGGIFMACLLPSNYLPLPALVSYLTGLVISVFTIWLTIRLSRKAEADKCAKTGLTIMLVIITEIVVINLIKIPWGRVRMRLVAVDSRAYFMPWWQAGSDLKNQLTAVGVAAEEFKSFPSGHAANAATLLLLPLFYQLFGNKPETEKLLFSIGLIWTTLVMVSRIIMGAHYLTDTVIGVLVAYLIIILVIKLLWKRRVNKQ